MQQAFRAYNAEAAVSPFTIVKPGANPRGALPASTPQDLFLGTAAELSPQAGQRFDVLKAGVGLVQAGAAFAVGVPLTSDANGNAVQAAPAAGSNARIIGFAEEAATQLGDIVRYWVAPGYIQG